MGTFYDVDSGQRISGELLSLAPAAGRSLEARVVALESELSALRSRQFTGTTEIYAQVTTRTAPFAWVQIMRNSANTGWQAKPSGMTSTTTSLTAQHFRGATNLPANTQGTLRMTVDGGAVQRAIFYPFEQWYPAIVTSSSAAYGSEHSWTYTVAFADSSSAGLTGFAAQDATTFTAYNLFEKVDREAAGSLELDPDDSGTDNGTIQAVENESVVMIAWTPTTDGSGGAWYFERTNSILADCEEDA